MKMAETDLLNAVFDDICTVTGETGKEEFKCAGDYIKYLYFYKERLGWDLQEASIPPKDAPASVELVRTDEGSEIEREIEFTERKIYFVADHVDLVNSLCMAGKDDM